MFSTTTDNEKRFVSAKARIVFGEVRSVSNELENQYSLQFSKSAVKLDILLKFLLLCQVDIQKGSLKDNTKFNFLWIIWESKRSLESIFLTFRVPEMQNFGPRDVLGLLKAPCFEIMGVWNLCFKEVFVFF